MRSILIFAVIQTIVYIFSMSNAITISLIVLSSAVILFAGAYLSARMKDKRHQNKTVKALLELQ